MSVKKTKRKTNTQDSFSTKRIKSTRATLVFVNIFILINLSIVPAAIYVGNVVQKSISAQNTLLFDGSKASNWKGQQNTKNTCGSYAKDISTVPPGKTGTSIEIFLKDGCTWVNNGVDTGTERVELATNGQFEFTEGTVWYIDWYQKFDQLAQPHSTDWDHWLQFHYPGGGSQPNLAMSTVNSTNNMQLKTSIGCDTTRQWLGPSIQTNKWYRFTLGVKTSASASTGWVELYLDGNNVLPKKNVATLDPNPKQCSSTSTVFTGNKGYLKKGIYRQPAISGDERYTMYGLKVSSTNPISGTSSSSGSSTTPSSGSGTGTNTGSSGSTSGGTSTGDTSTDSSTTGSNSNSSNTETKTNNNQDPEIIADSSAQTQNTAIKIPDNAIIKENRTIIADFNGDKIPDVAYDENGDFLIDSENEVIIDGNTNPEIINRAKNNELTETDRSLLNAKSTIPQKDFNLKLGPLPELTISKLFAYNLALGGGFGLLTLSSYWALVKFPIFSGLRMRLGL